MKVLITGGAGFIGSNAARRFRALGHETVLFDNLSRPAARYNLRWLQRQHPDVRFVQGDVRNENDLRIVGEGFDAILHLAAQVAVTTSIVDPLEDWGSNALGTFRLLEAIRRRYGSSPEKAPLLVYASTNKVYGHLTSGETLRDGRWDLAVATTGVSESETLSFESPYGCSKGAADQYVIDYHRSYGLPTVAYRQSCIFGPRQFGEEDQGWVAWFALAATFGLPITIYGDGLQVRDLLWVDDLVDAYLAAIERRETVAGRAYNMGGGPAFRLSLMQLIRMLEERLGHPIEVAHGPARLGDQKVFYCDIGRAREDLGWQPKVDPATGVDRLLGWISENRGEITEFLSRKGIRVAAG
ncbi:MAG TPA: NAD-dependent epimerase/dehydratase family protein [Thermoanaerobaculia bacterium]|nr:NAD-dependent epimerase/dehydratase family protein [Thermoanaerobaculia bacterium]